MVSDTYEGFPGAVAVSRLSVYDWPTIDGHPGGGTPHLHLACTEGYVVISGRGSVQTLTTSGYREDPLEAGAVVWFTPGTIHRLVNEDALRITVVMQNSGLPEAGDAVLTMPPELLTDPATYADAVRIPAEGTEEERAGTARRRRDLATRRFLALREATEHGRPRPARRLPPRRRRPRTAPARRLAHRLREGAEAATRASGAQLAALREGNAEHLAHARVTATGPTARGRFGMCGRLDVYTGS